MDEKIREWLDSTDRIIKDYKMKADLGLTQTVTPSRALNLVDLLKANKKLVSVLHQQNKRLRRQAEQREQEGQRTVWRKIADFLMGGQVR